MLEFSDTAASVLQSSNITYYVRAEAWLGDELLMELPSDSIIKGTESVDRSLNVPEVVTLTFPRIYDGVDLSPYNDDSPLSANGQTLRVEVGVGLAYGNIEWVQRGWYLIYDSNVDGDTVEVEAKGLLTWILEARFVTPFQPSGSITTTVRNLVEPALTVVFDTSLTDRSVPTGINYTDDRLDTLNAVLDAWPAIGYVNSDGDLFVTSATPSTTPVKTLSEFTDGTVVKVVGGSSRDGVYNAVVARGTDTNGNVVQGNVAYDTSTARSIIGNFNPLPVPLYFDSPLLTDVNTATQAAKTRLDNIIRQTTKAYEVSMVPDPSLETGDTVLLESRFGDIVGTVESMTLPFTPDGSMMTLIVRAL
jgi:hypothetical protein